MFFNQTVFEDVIKTQRKIGIFGGIINSLFQRNKVKGNLVFAAAANLFISNHFVVKKQHGQFIKPMPMLRWIQHIRQNCGIFNRKNVAVFAQNLSNKMQVKFNIMSDFENRLAFHEWSQIFFYGCKIQQRNLILHRRKTKQITVCCAVIINQRQISSFADIRRDGNPYDFIKIRVKAGCFGIKSKGTFFFNLFSPFF